MEFELITIIAGEEIKQCFYQRSENNGYWQLYMKGNIKILCYFDMYIDPLEEGITQYDCYYNDILINKVYDFENALDFINSYLEKLELDKLIVKSDLPKRPKMKI